MADIHRYPAAEIAARAAEIICGRLRAAVANKGHASLAIPGGSALAPMPAIRAGLESHWKKLRLTWVDERCVDFADPDSNRGEAYRSGALDAADPPEIELPLWLDGETPEGACERVGASLARDFSDALEVALLGMGPDGHIASLFPGHELLRSPSSEPIQHLRDSPKPPPQRMTLSLAFLKKTRHCYLVALGESKRAALLRVLQNDLELPLSHLGNLTIFTDIDLGATS